MALAFDTGEGIEEVVPEEGPGLENGLGRRRPWFNEAGHLMEDLRSSPWRCED